MSDQLANIGGTARTVREQVGLLNEVMPPPPPPPPTLPPSVQPTDARNLISDFANFKKQCREFAAQSGGVVHQDEADKLAFTEFENRRKRESAVAQGQAPPKAEESEFERLSQLWTKNYGKKPTLTVKYPIGELNPQFIVLRYISDPITNFEDAFERFRKGFFDRPAALNPKRAAYFDDAYNSAEREGIAIINGYNESDEWVESCQKFMRNVLAVTLQWTQPQASRKEVDQVLFLKEQTFDGLEVEACKTTDDLANKVANFWTNLYEVTSVTYRATAAKVTLGQAQKTAFHNEHRESGQKRARKNEEEERDEAEANRFFRGGRNRKFEPRKTNM